MDMNHIFWIWMKRDGLIWIPFQSEISAHLSASVCMWYMTLLQRRKSENASNFHAENLDSTKLVVFLRGWPKLYQAPRANASTKYEINLMIFFMEMNITNVVVGWTNGWTGRNTKSLLCTYT